MRLKLKSKSSRFKIRQAGQDGQVDAMAVHMLRQLEQELQSQVAGANQTVPIGTLITESDDAQRYWQFGEPGRLAIQWQHGGAVRTLHQNTERMTPFAFDVASVEPDPIIGIAFPSKPCVGCPGAHPR